MTSAPPNERRRPRYSVVSAIAPMCITGFAVMTSSTSVSAETTAHFATADLTITAVSVPALGVEDSGVLELSVSNLGPGVSGTTRVNYLLRRGLSYDETAALPNCALIDETLSCAVAGPIRAQASVVISLPIHTSTWLPNGSTFAPSRASLSDQSVIDPNSDNDSVAIEIGIDRPTASTQYPSTQYPSIEHPPFQHPAATTDSAGASASTAEAAPIPITESTSLNVDDVPESLALGGLSVTSARLVGLVMFAAGLWLVGVSYVSSDETGA